MERFVTVSRGEELGKRNVLAAGPVPILVGEDVGRYELRPPSHFVTGLTKGSDAYAAPKVVVVKTGSRCVAALDLDGVATMQSLYNLHVDGVDPKAVLGILNSSFVQWFVDKTFTAYKLLFPQLNQTTLLGIPVPGDLSGRQGPLVDEVDGLSVLHRELGAARAPSDLERIGRELAAADRRIDDLVYGLFGLSSADRAVLLRDGAQPTAGLEVAGD